MWRCDVAGFKSRSPVIAAQQRVMKITIDKDGSVYKAEGVSGPPELVPAAVEAVKQWKYQPCVLNGEAVEVETTAEITLTQQIFAVQEFPPAFMANSPSRPHRDLTLILSCP
jgi:hypothetical protein